MMSAVQATVIPAASFADNPVSHLDHGMTVDAAGNHVLSRPTSMYHNAGDVTKGMMAMLSMDPTSGSSTP